MAPGAPVVQEARPAVLHAGGCPQSLSGAWCWLLVVGRGMSAMPWSARLLSGRRWRQGPGVATGVKTGAQKGAGAALSGVPRPLPAVIGDTACATGADA